MEFRHEVIDDDPPCGRLGICQTTDLTGTGLPDLIVGGMGAQFPVSIAGKEIVLRQLPVVGDLVSRLETNLFWYENETWERHDITDTPGLYVFGNALGDLTGNGQPDLVVGQGLNASDIYWFECPINPRNTWPKHLLSSKFTKYHDLAVGDVDDDGEPEVVGLSQQSETVFYYDVPSDPTVEPWPDENLHIVADDVNVEGVEIVDLDGDGRTEIVAGTNVFHRRSAGWEREEIVSGWDWTRVAVADLDGDGELEVVLSEGDSPLLGTRPGRVAWFDPPDWEEHLLRADLFCPHSLQVADVDGSGRPDIYVAEMAHGQHDDPKHLLFRNRGDGTFEETVIARGVETHEAKVVDLDGDDALDIVGKSYTPDHHVDAWYNVA